MHCLLRHSRTHFLAQGVHQQKGCQVSVDKILARVCAVRQQVQICRIPSVCFVSGVPLLQAGEALTSCCWARQCGSIRVQASWCQKQSNSSEIPRGPDCLFAPLSFLRIEILFIFSGLYIFTKLCDLHHYLTPDHSHHPQRNPVPIISDSPFCPSPSSQQPLIYFLTLWICLFWTFHINGIIQYVAFVSGFFHLASCFQGSSVLQNIPVLHFFLWLNNPCLSFLFLSSVFITWTFCPNPGNHWSCTSGAVFTPALVGLGDGLPLPFQCSSSPVGLCS